MKRFSFSFLIILASMLAMFLSAPACCKAAADTPDAISIQPELAVQADLEVFEGMVYQVAFTSDGAYYILSADEGFEHDNNEWSPDMISFIKDELKSRLVDIGITEKNIYTSAAAKSRHKVTPSVVILTDKETLQYINKRVGKVATDDVRYYRWKRFSRALPFVLEFYGKDMASVEQVVTELLVKISAGFKDANDFYPVSDIEAAWEDDESQLRQEPGCALIFTVSGGIYENVEIPTVKSIKVSETEAPSV